LILVSYTSGKDNGAPPHEQLYDKIFGIKQSLFAAVGYSSCAFILGKPIQIGYYFSLRFLFKLKAVIKIEKPDLYIAHLLRMVPYLNLCNLRDKSIVEMTDALSKTYSLSNIFAGFSVKRLVYKIEKKRIAKYEKDTIACYKKCVLVSEADKNYLSGL
jgi:hypothetical protein